MQTNTDYLAQPHLTQYEIASLQTHLTQDEIDSFVNITSFSENPMIVSQKIFEMIQKSRSADNSHERDTSFQRLYVKVKETQEKIAAPELFIMNLMNLANEPGVAALVKDIFQDMLESPPQDLTSFDLIAIKQFIDENHSILTPQALNILANPDLSKILPELKTYKKQLPHFLASIKSLIDKETKTEILNIGKDIEKEVLSHYLDEEVLNKYREVIEKIYAWFSTNIKANIGDKAEPLANSSSYSFRYIQKEFTEFLNLLTFKQNSVVKEEKLYGDMLAEKFPQDPQIENDHSLLYLGFYKNKLATEGTEVMLKYLHILSSLLIGETNNANRLLCVSLKEIIYSLIELIIVYPKFRDGKVSKVWLQFVQKPLSEVEKQMNGVEKQAVKIKA